MLCRHQVLLVVVVMAMTMLLHGAHGASSEESDGQILKRVKDHLDSFMDAPVQAIHRAQRFLLVGGFPSLEAADRDFVSKWMWMELFLYVYYGLEDGSFLIYNDPRTTKLAQTGLLLREPGFSGYSTDPVPDESIKHWTSCVDNMGNPRNCTLPEGSLYVKCIDDCNLTKCDIPQEHCQRLSVASEERTACEESIQWCPQYVIETVQAGENLGTVPAFNTCVNQYGAPDQTPGNVVISSFEGSPFQEQQLGNCYFRDNVTLVNSTLEGEYAYCGEGECNPYIGGYESVEYDPRYRPWYMASKDLQQPLWSDPYVFFDQASVGITYTEPIYAVEGQRKVFKGVFAVDYTFETIQEFLEQFKGSGFMVAVVEAAEPNNIIATSTGSLPVELVSCPDVNTLMGCTVARKTINDMDGNPEDRVLQRAFEAQAGSDFPVSDLIPFKRTDALRDEAFFSQGGIFEQPNTNLMWRIVVATPMEQSSTDAAYVGTAPFYIILTVALVGFIFCISLFYTFFSLRRHRAIQNADWRFTCAFIFGCSMLNLSSLSLLGGNRNELCMLRMWLYNLLFASGKFSSRCAARSDICHVRIGWYFHVRVSYTIPSLLPRMKWTALSPLFVKVWRMYKLLHASSQFRRVSVTNVKAMLYTLPIIVAELVILSVFSVVDPSRAIEDLGETHVEFGQIQSVTCQHDTKAFLLTQTIFDAFLILIGCYLAFATRNLDARFGEAKQLGFAMYNTAFTGIVLILISTLVEMDPAIQLLLQATGVAWGTMFNSAAFVVPRVMQVQRQKLKLNRMKSVHSRKKFVLQGDVEVLVEANSAQLSSYENVDGWVTNTPDSEDDALDPDNTNKVENNVRGDDGHDSPEYNEEFQESSHSHREDNVKWADQLEVGAINIPEPSSNNDKGGNGNTDYEEEIIFMNTTHC
jgi:hypothetical protein